MRRKLSRRSLAPHAAIYFDQSEYVANVLEEQPSEQRVVQIQAHNADKIPLYYSMVATDGRSLSLFQINKVSGVVTTRARLDRESMPQHQFRVVAYDASNPTHSATTLLTVHVTDINDFAPVFEKQLYAASVSENIEVGSTVLHVHATDGDVNSVNGDVSYAILNALANPEFELDARTGVLSIRRSLDRERKAFYRLTVRATDGSAENPRFTDTSVEVTVEDENDNFPAFTDKSYRFEVREDLDPTTHPVIGTVRATDADLNENGKVHYSFVSGNSRNQFSIDYKSGELSLIAPLNYRLLSQYELVVRAQVTKLTPYPQNGVFGVCTFKTYFVVPKLTPHPQNGVFGVCAFQNVFCSNKTYPYLKISLTPTFPQK